MKLLWLYIWWHICYLNIFLTCSAFESCHNFKLERNKIHLFLWWLKVFDSFANMCMQCEVYILIYLNVLQNLNLNQIDDFPPCFNHMCVCVLTWVLCCIKLPQQGRMRLYGMAFNWYPSTHASTRIHLSSFLHCIFKGTIFLNVCKYFKKHPKKEFARSCWVKAVAHLFIFTWGTGAVCFVRLVNGTSDPPHERPSWWIQEVADQSEKVSAQPPFSPQIH